MKGIFSLSFVMAFPPYAIKGEEGAPLRGSPFCRFEVDRYGFLFFFILSLFHFRVSGSMLHFLSFSFPFFRV